MMVGTDATFGPPGIAPVLFALHSRFASAATMPPTSSAVPLSLCPPLCLPLRLSP